MRKEGKTILCLSSPRKTQQQFKDNPTQGFREDDSTPLQCSCLENPTDEGAWWASVHGVAKSRTQLSDFTFTFHFHTLEKAMAPHSSILVWRIPGTGKPGGLPSLRSHRVGHDCSDLAVAQNNKQHDCLFSILDSFGSFCKSYLLNLPNSPLSNCNPHPHPHIPHAQFTFWSYHLLWNPLNFFPDSVSSTA